MRCAPREVGRCRIISCILAILLAGTGAGFAPMATAQSSRFDCIVHQTKATGDPDWTPAGVIWTSRQQSLFGCEGWLYAMAIRVRHIVYGEWGSGYLDANENGRVGEWNVSQKQWVQRIPDYMKDLLNDQMQSLNKFWSARFSGSQISYTEPGVTRLLGSGI